MILAVTAVEISSRVVVSITIISSSSAVADLTTTTTIVEAEDSCRIANRVAQMVVTCSKG